LFEVLQNIVLVKIPQNFYKFSKQFKMCEKANFFSTYLRDGPAPHFHFADESAAGHIAAVHIVEALPENRRELLLPGNIFT